MPRLTIVLLGAAGLVAIVLIVRLSHRSPRRDDPEQTVRKFVRSINEKNLNSLLLSIDPAKENLARELCKQLDGCPPQAWVNVLPGLNQIFGNPFPDDWQLDEIQVLDKKLEDDLAWITITTTLTTRTRDVKQKETKKAKFALHNFRGVGWRIVDIRLEPEKLTSSSALLWLGRMPLQEHTLSRHGFSL